MGPTNKSDLVDRQGNPSRFPLDSAVDDSVLRRTDFSPFRPVLNTAIS